MVLLACRRHSSNDQRGSYGLALISNRFSTCWRKSGYDAFETILVVGKKSKGGEGQNGILLFYRPKSSPRKTSVRG